MRNSLSNRVFVTILLLAIGIGSGWVVRQWIFPAGGQVADPVGSDEPTAFELMQQGDDLLSENRYSEALARYRSALQLSPNEAALHARIGQLYLDKNRLDDAEQSLVIALQLEPDQPTWRVDLAQTYLEQGDLEEAVNQAEQVVVATAADAPQAKAQEIIARVRLEQGENDPAKVALDEWLALEPDNAEALQLRALLFVPDDLSQALALLSQVPDLTDDASLLDKATAARARLENWEQDLGAAAERLQVGVFFLEQNLPAIAINWLRPLAEEIPDYATAHMNLGYAYLLTGDQANAQLEFERTFELQADPPPVFYYYRGQLWEAQGLIDDAIRNYEKAIDNGLENAEVYLKLGQSLQARGDFTQAVLAYEKSIELAPDQLTVRTTLVNLLLTQLKDYATAREVAESTILAFPESGRSYSMLGWVLLEEGQLEAAEKALQSALQLDPDDPSTYLNLGNLYRERGETEQAIEAYRRALDEDFTGDIAKLADQAIRDLNY